MGALAGRLNDADTSVASAAAAALGCIGTPEAVAERVVCLPMYNEIRDETVALIAEVVREAVA